MLDTRGAAWKNTRRRTRADNVSVPNITSWKIYYEIDREPIGRGYAGKVYKITKINGSSHNNEQLNTSAASAENPTCGSTVSYACKAIRRWRAGRDTISKIKREIAALCRLQSYHHFSPEHLNLSCIDVDELKNYSKFNSLSMAPTPPSSASPRILAIHEDPMEVAIVMEYAIGGSLYALCQKFYPNAVYSSPFNSWCAHHATAPQSHFSERKVDRAADLCGLVGANSTRTGLPENYVIQVIQKILDALDYMHKHMKLVHLDIKAENILLRQPYPSTDVFITDFGLATVLTEGKQHRELAGTPDYVAPEIINYDPIGFSTDMWSVGILTYFLLTGVSPFLASEKEITMQRITHGPIEFPDDLFHGRSQQSVVFLRGLIVRTPSQRMTAEQCLKHEWIRSINQSEQDIQLSHHVVINESPECQKLNSTPQEIPCDDVAAEIDIPPMNKIMDGDATNGNSTCKAHAETACVNSGAITKLRRVTKRKPSLELLLRMDPTILSSKSLDASTINTYIQGLLLSNSLAIQSKTRKVFSMDSMFIRSVSAPPNTFIPAHCEQTCDMCDLHLEQGRSSKRASRITHLTVRMVPNLMAKQSEKLEHSVSTMIYLKFPDLGQITKADGDSWKVCNSQYTFNRLECNYFPVAACPSSFANLACLLESATTRLSIFQPSLHSVLPFSSRTNVSEARTHPQNETDRIQNLNSPALDWPVSSSSEVVQKPQCQQKRSIIFRFCHRLLVILDSILSADYVTSLWPPHRSRK
ncbi:hypothetical protein CRM22_002775 [Opisthorchis felineus]|uniref:Protein kinase domain-containing protein n=1 Tax=Opisthorchis felineus TaxID=147828 RepID=A0A4S2M4G3_OPIFE|nr:hypothetical protein CRM22_002775 [Opisthorchis felineus]